LSGGQFRAGKARLALKEFDRVFVIAAGKAAVPMAAAASQILGRVLTGGIAVTKHGHARRTLRKIAVLEAGHPIPDEFGLIASEKARMLLQELNARDLLIVLVSGGASGVLPAPPEPITLRAKQQTTDLLLRAGANIAELNAVRKHLSLLKGGKLAALAYPATVVSLLLSDVIGDPLETIGSGLTAPDPTTFSDALAVLDKYRVRNRVPNAVRNWLQEGAAARAPETPKPGNPIFQNVHNVIVGGNRLALEAAALKSGLLGYRTLILSSTMHGETREVARVHAQVLREIRRSSHPISPPACILSGGETTVTVQGRGKGGRNQEFALAAAIEIRGLRDSLIASLGTDGTDGPTDAAGAIVTGQTVSRAASVGLDAAAYLRANDSYPFFDALRDLIRTGPTGTNVMDIHLMLAGS
jgi:hydroxypyruvate reductase